MQPAETTVAFIGTGVMGASMAGHLLDAGFNLRVHNRTRSKAEPLLARGAKWAASPGEAARGADVVITIVGYPSDVEEVFLGEGGIVESAQAEDAADRHDDLVAGARGPHRQGRCRSVGSSRSTPRCRVATSGRATPRLPSWWAASGKRFERAMPVFSAMGKTVLHHGGPGAGQHCKMANQIAIAASMLGLAECLSYAAAAGLDRERVLETLNGGSAQTWTLANYGPRVLADDFEPGFYVKHFVKDLRIALASAESMRVELPGLELAKRLYEALAAGGGSDLGTQAIWLLYAQPAQREAAGVLGGVTAQVATTPMNPILIAVLAAAVMLVPGYFAGKARSWSPETVHGRVLRLARRHGGRLGVGARREAESGGGAGLGLWLRHGQRRSPRLQPGLRAASEPRRRRGARHLVHVEQVSESLDTKVDADTVSESESGRVQATVVEVLGVYPCTPVLVDVNLHERDLVRLEPRSARERSPDTTSGST